MLGAEKPVKSGFLSLKDNKNRPKDNKNRPKDNKNRPRKITKTDRKITFDKTNVILIE